MRVLIVEDNQSLASLIAKRLEQAGIESDQAMSSTQGEQALNSLHYEAVILDLGLPDGDGLQLLREMRKAGDSTPVLITTARHGLEDRVRGLREGADDYLPKPFSVEELLARLQALLRRPKSFVGDVLRAGNVELDTQHRQVSVAGKVLPTRLREAFILELLMRKVGSVVKRSHLEDQLFGLDSQADSNTVDVYIHRLRRQLLDAGADATIHTIRGVGYMLSVAGQQLSTNATLPRRDRA